MKDEELIIKVQGGEIESFEEIVKRFEKPLFWYIKTLTNQNNEEVEDILQEVFINAYINIQGFDYHKKFSSWIYRIAHNKAIDFFKKRRIKWINTEESDDLVWQEKLIEDLEIEKEEKIKLLDTVNKLEIKYREILILHYFEDKDYEEISDILKTPVNNVRVMIFRAKKMLKDKLEKEYEK